MVLATHLHAMREMFSSFSTQGYTLPESPNEMEQLLCLAYEEYSFLSSCNSTTPLNAPKDEPHSMLHDVPSSSEASRFAGLERLRGAETIFPGSYKLFGLIPQIQRLYCRRIAEDAAGEPAPTQQSLDIFNDLKGRINAREGRSKSSPNIDEPALTNILTSLRSQREQSHSIARASNDGSRRHLEMAEEDLAAQCVRHALYVYALTSLEGPSAGLRHTSQHIQGVIQVNAEAAIEIALSLTNTCYLSHLLWPVLIAASCMIEPEYRKALTQLFAQTPYEMRNVATAAKVLHLLWADEDPRAYGPHGLIFESEKHGLNLSWI